MATEVLTNVRLTVIYCCSCNAGFAWMVADEMVKQEKERNRKR